MNEIFKNPRPLTDWELSIIMKMLSVNFPGSEELMDQVKYLSVSEEVGGNDPTIYFVIDDNAIPSYSVDLTVPVEAETFDEDGMHIFILLHVNKGYISELEFLRGDSYNLMRLPDSDSLVLFAPRPYYGPTPSEYFPETPTSQD